MKIEKSITEYKKDLNAKVEQIVNQVLDEALQELKASAPKDTGLYAFEMKKENAIRQGNIIKGRVYNDSVVTTKDGREYSLGEILEYGTEPHAIPNAFGWGDIYGYDSAKYRQTLDSEWHPGTMPQPHWQPVTDKTEIKLERLLKNL